ncbi:MAG TPA: hypothetical protein VLT34_17920 [Arthrobacter sp.]|nr:hypothetical protein [Arthrobacter sp.]
MRARGRNILRPATAHLRGGGGADEDARLGADKRGDDDDAAAGKGKGKGNGKGNGKGEEAAAEEVVRPAARAISWSPTPGS